MFLMDQPSTAALGRIDANDPLTQLIGQALGLPSLGLRRLLQSHGGSAYHDDRSNTRRLTDKESIYTQEETHMEPGNGPDWKTMFLWKPVVFQVPC